MPFIPQPDFEFHRTDTKKLIKFNDADHAPPPWTITAALIGTSNASKARWSFVDVGLDPLDKSLMQGWLQFDWSGYPTSSDACLESHWPKPGNTSQVTMNVAVNCGGQPRTFVVQLMA